MTTLANCAFESLPPARIASATPLSSGAGVNRFGGLISTLRACLSSLFRRAAVRRIVPPLAVLLLVGCAAPPLTSLAPGDLRPYEGVGLREGDVVKIAFPGAPSLNTAQQVRRDGKISLDQGNELTAAGKTPAELEADILKLYADRLASKEVSVTVDSSAYPVYLSGAVLRPGKIMVTHAITVVEAIMEAGGFDESRAKSTAVVVTREEDGKVKNYRLDVRAMLEGRSQVRFYMHPMDAIYVPTKVQIW